MFQSNVNIVIQIRKAASQILLHDCKIGFQWFLQRDKQNEKKTRNGLSNEWKKDTHIREQATTRLACKNFPHFVINTSYAQ